MDIRALIEREIIETSGLRTHPARQCGIYAVSTSDDGERSFSYWRRCFRRAHALFR